MTDKDITPIPKYIEKRIRAFDKEYCPAQKGLRFYAYLTTIKKELVKITVAMRNKNKTVQLIKQVAVRGVYSDKCLVKDIEYCYLGIYAYRVGWYDEGIKYRYGIRPFYNDGLWYPANFKYYNPYAPVINMEFALKYFPYCALNLFSPACPIKYLRTYIKYPQTEYLVKLGLSSLVYSKMILERIGKDKSFCKWLIKNSADIKNNFYYITTIISAYKKGKSLEETQRFEKFKKDLITDSNYKPFRTIFKDNPKRLFNYIEKNNTSLRSYKDYYDACSYLKLDMTEEKNLLPHDFKRWHNERIEQYKTLKFAELQKRRQEQIARDEKERSKRFESFIAVSKQYLPLAGCTQNGLVIVIAGTPADLVMEGQALNHCVGGLNYTDRMANGESLIFFVRNAANPEVPFVTLEYSIKQKRVLQCYAYDNTRPNDTVLDFVNNIWLPFANKQITKIKRAKRIAA